MTSVTRRDLLKGVSGVAGLALATACSQTSTPASAPAATAAPAGAAAQSPAQTAPPAVAAPGSTASITYWGAFGGHNADVQQQLVDRYNGAQKDVQVTLQNQNDYQTLAAKLTTALQAKNAPEVVLLSDVWWFKFYLNKTLQPLDDLMAAEKISPSDYVDVFYKETVRAGKQVVLPFARSTPIFYYNKDAWAKAGLPDRGPDTWDEFNTDFAPKLKPLAPIVHAFGGAASYSAWVFQGVDWAYGGSYSDPDFTIRIQEPNSVKAGELWRSMVSGGVAQASKDPATDFNSGAVLSYLDSTAGLAGHESAAKFQVGTAFLPQGPAGFGCCTGGSGMAITAASPKEKQQAEMKFIAYATGTDTVFWSQNTGYMPVRNAALQGAEMKTFFEAHPNFKTTADQLPKTRPQDSARELVPNGDEIIGKGLERITANNEPADAVFKDVADQLNTEKQPVLRALKDLGEA
ncbi:MAG: ABC transporter substrate-binding protein [Chloroflexota bacterium]|nr:ABC transporter substrate-binding protein [Chloroflexota bacterium]